jgi:competence protein ComEA
MKLVSQIVLIAAILAAVAGGLVLLARGSSTGRTIEIVIPTATPVPEESLQVYVSGAVRFPGVYSVKAGDRLAQAIESAGGAREDSDLTAVNLAVRLKDEDHWHIPKVGESRQPTSGPGGGQSEKINVNSATAEELDSLPGIGEVKARAIISYRERNGPFASLEELLAVRGIGPATLDGIRDLVTVR